MLSQTLLQQQFQRVLELARQTHSGYGSLSGRLSDPRAAVSLDQMLRDKQRHVALAERLLEIVQ